jgi:hypothetical protein
MKIPTVKSDFIYRIQVESWPVFLLALFLLLAAGYGCYRLTRGSRRSTT